MKFKLASLFFVTMFLALLLVPIKLKLDRAAEFAQLKKRYTVVEVSGHLLIAPSEGVIEDTDLELLLSFSNQVTEINFSGRDLSNCTTKFLEHMDACQVLVLDGCKLPPSFFSQNLSRLKRLRELYLEASGLSDSDVRYLSKLSGLQRVCLGNNEISDEEPLLLLASNNKALEYFDLRDTNVTKETSSRIQSTLKEGAICLVR